MNFECREQRLFLAIAIFLFSIQAHSQINVALQLNHPTCGGFATGNIMAVPIGGMSPYTYKWSTGSTNNPLTFIPAGSYSVTVTDVNGSTGTATGVLVEPPPLQVQILVTDCGVPGAMLGVVNGGIPPFEFEWSTGDTSQAISYLLPDTYCLTVTDLNSCAFQLCESIGNPMSLTVNTTPAICGTGDGGSAWVDVAGGVAPFNYKWSNGATSDSISTLPPGPYTVTVTAENGCTVSDTGEVDFIPGSFPLSFDVIDPNCMGMNTGSLSAIPINAVPPYTFEWSNDSTTQTITNLVAGTYYVSVTDLLGCYKEDSVRLQMPEIIQLEIDSIAHPTCQLDSNGYIKVTATDGVAPYLYVWNTGDSTQYIDSLAAGTYIITVTDELNCVTIDSFKITDPDSLFVNLEITEPSHCGAENGSLVATPVGGGNDLFQYLWTTGDTLSFLENIGSGDYGVTITSEEGCTAHTNVSLEEPLILDVSIGGSGIVCHNQTNGQLTAYTTHGSPPYTYLWNNGGTTKTINNLGPGIYSVTVTSSEGCTGSDTTTINHNPQITIAGTVTHVKCFGNSNGSINISVGGGTPPLNISWPNGSNSTILNNLQAGSYTVTVTDAVGCSNTKTFSVTQPSKIDINFSSSQGSCGNNGFSIALVSGGVQPYQYLWSNGSTTNMIDGVPPGTYFVTITDANGCIKTNSVTIPPYTGFNLNVASTNTTCNGTTDGTASAVTFGGISPFTYLWSNGGTTSSINGLTPGLYEVTVTDGNGCTATGDAEVELGSGLATNILADTTICPGDFGSATAQAFGGNPSFYTYIWSNGETTKTIEDLTPGTYRVTVSTPSGCTGEASITLVTGGLFNVNSSFQNVKCAGDSTGSISLNVTAGQPPYSFIWSNGATTSAVQNIPAGNYSVTVSDLSECQKVLDFTITEPPKLEVEVTGIDGICGNLGSATSQVTGGTTPYFYQWSNGSTSPNINILGNGNYTLTVTDLNNCKSQDSATVSIISSVSCGIELVQPVSAPGGNNGSLDANLANGTGPFTFHWNNGKTTQTINNLPAGNYTVTVTDSNGCISTCSFFLLDGAEIGDFVWEDLNEDGIQDLDEMGLGGVDILLTGMDDYGSAVSLNTTSNSSGAYLFNLPPGDYELTFVVPNGYVPSPMSQGGDVGLDSDADPLTNKTGIITIGPGAQNHSIDAGFFVEINCDNITDAGAVCCDQILCGKGETPAPLTNAILPSGGSGTLEYIWMSTIEAIPFDPNTWTILSNSNVESFDPTALDTTTYFIRRARRSGCSQFFESNVIEVAVHEIPSPVIDMQDVVCVGDSIIANGNDVGPSTTYGWTFENGNPANGTSPIISAVTWDSLGAFEISYTIENEGCQATALDTILVTDLPDYCGYELILHGVKTDTSTVLLDWEYPESDTVNRTYTVEWEWENNGFGILGAADSIADNGSFIHYFRTHEGMLVGRNAYRVTLMDSDGTTLVSNVVEFQRDSIPIIVDPEKDHRLVHSYPNPFGVTIYIDVYDRFENVPITIELFNPLGQLVHFMELGEETDRFEIDAKDYPSGAYFMFVRYAGKPQKVFKFIKGR